MLSRFVWKAALWAVLMLACGAFAPPQAAFASNAKDTGVKPLTAKEERQLDKMALPVPTPTFGDFDDMQKRRLVRILVPYNKMFYFVDRGRQLGGTYELGLAFEQFLNKKVKSKSLRMRVAFIPTSRDKLVSELLAGRGDIAAGGLTITPERLKSVDFANPTATGIKEVVVMSANAPVLASVDDLAGREVTVRKTSSYHEHLVALNERFKKEGKKPIKIAVADDDLESGDLLEMVNAGLITYTVADDFVAAFWKQVYPKIQVRDDVVVNDGGEIGWMVRKDSPLLVNEINTFMKTHGQGSAFLNTVVAKYIKNAKYVKNATSDAELKKFNALVEIFRKYGKEYDFDYLMLMAQGYQESQLNQSAKSPRGAVGVMQLLPETAASNEVGIKGIDKDAEKNIHAGTRYLRRLTEHYLNDPGLDQKNKTLMAFAAYNAGPGNLNKFRRLAEKEGLNRDIWFNNVEIAAAQVVGRETVDYVSNIYKYYVAYKLAQERGQ